LSKLDTKGKKKPKREPRPSSSALKTTTKGVSQPSQQPQHLETEREVEGKRERRGGR